MDVTAPLGERASPSRPGSGLPFATVLIFVLSAASFVWMRAGTAMPYPEFQGACARLREVGLAITPRDTFCQPIPWTSRVAYVVASLLIAAGFVLAGVFLAAADHRLTAFVPLLLAPAMTDPHSLILSVPWWPGGSAGSTALTLLVMAAPVAAVMFAMRRTRVAPSWPTMIAGIASSIVCGAGVTGVVFVAHDLLARHYGELVGNVDIAGIVPPMIAIAVFGALLGPDSRWWPWSIAPIAILLSAGPSSALIVGPQRLLDWSQFGLVVPLFAVGLIASAWRPLAAGLTRLFPDEESPCDEPSLRSNEPALDRRRVRPVVVLNAAAIGLLAVSLIVFRADPLPAQLGQPIPTYLGARVLAQNLRTKLDLRQTMTAMDAYRAEHGTYGGFDDGSASATHIDVVVATDGEARLAALSESGEAFCLQRSKGQLTFGSSGGDATPGADAVEQAVARCGSTMWTAAVVRPFPIATMCEGVDGSGGYLLCRVVQALMTKTMQRR